MESIAKYILYYNVNTHDLYDASGAFMGNTPFSVYFDNLISVELHYMEDTSSDSISDWVPWTALEGNTVGSSICFDDEYIHAKTGKIYTNASVGDTSLIVHVSLDSEVVNPTGVLVVYKNDESISIPYTGYIENNGIYTFNLQNPLQIQLNQGGQVRVPQALLLKVDSDAVDHSRSSDGIFSFSTRVLSHKLLNKLIYGNSSSVSGTFEHQIVSDGNIVFTVTFAMKVNSLLSYDGQADIPKSGNWADKAYVDSKIITKTSELQNDAGFISEEVDPVYNADKPNIALKSELFSKNFADLLYTPTTLAGYGITDVKIEGNTITISDKSITIEPPEPLSKTAVDEVIGVRSSGSAKKFYNEQGKFVSVDGVKSVNGAAPDENGDVFIDIGDLISSEGFLNSIGAVLKVNGVEPENGEVTLGLDNFIIQLPDESQESFGTFIINFYDAFAHLEAYGVQFSNSQYSTVGGALSGLIYRVEQLEGGSGGGSGGGTVVSVDGISPDGNGDVQLTYAVMVNNDYITDSLVNWLNNFSYRIQQLESNQGSGGSSFSGSFNELTDLPTTLNGYGITDAYISGNTITLGSNSVTIPESSGGGEYTLTKEAVDGVIGASSTGSTAKFYNEQGAFTTVTGFLPLGGGTIDGDLWLNGTLYTDQSLFVTFRNTLTLGCYSTGGLPIEPDTVSELVLDKPNATARVKLVYTTESDTKKEAGLYLGAKSSSSDPSEIYVPGFIRIWTGSDKTDPMNRIGLNGAFGISIQSKSGVNISSDTNIFKFNSKNVAVVDDITAHNEDATAHTDLFALKEDTGVAQGLVDTHATITASSDTLGHIKVDNETITVDENGVATAHAVGHNIFDIFYSMSSKAPAGAVDLSLGTLITSCDTVFPDFWSECVARKAEGSIRTLTEDEWQAEATANGSCGAFVVDEEAKSVRLPKIINMIQPGDVGVFTKAGLPNITGDLKLRPNTTGYNTFFGFDGAFNMGSSTELSAAAFSVSTGTGTTYIPITFDASRSSLIYGNSTTVQPPAVGAKLYIQVFTSAVPASMAQAGEFINMLETKADRTELENYLPLAGGTMTGSIFTTVEASVCGIDTAHSAGINGGNGWGQGASYIAYGAAHASRPGQALIRACDGTNEARLYMTAAGVMNWTGNHISGANSAGNGLLLYAGSGNFDGATLQMFKRDHTSYAGQFYLRASTKDANSANGTNCDLVGKPNGTLTWGGNTIVPISASSITATGGYIKFANRVLIQWGYATYSGSITTQTVTFKTAFANTTYTFLRTGGGQNTSASGAYGYSGEKNVARTTTTATIQLGQNGTNYSWIAIGTW